MNRSVSLDWPDCPKCNFNVGVSPDSGLSVEARVARLAAEQRAIDSANHDPNATAGEFNEIDGLPEAFTGPGGRGFLINYDCGDCGSIGILFGRPGYVGHVAISGDDDIPNGGMHFCEMVVVGKTFAWRE